MNLDQILGAVFSGATRRNPAKDGDKIAAGAMATLDLDAGYTIESLFHGVVHIMMLTRAQPNIIEALDSLDNLLLVAKAQVLESIHDAYHGRAEILLAEGATEAEAKLAAETVNQHSFVGAGLTGCIPAGERDQLLPINHDALLAAIAHYDSRINEIAQAMQEHEARKEAGQPAH